jgi:hypothetical protein
MNVEFLPAQPIQNPVRNIVIDGNIVGTIEEELDTTKSWKYHVVLRHKEASSIFQGFGKTHDEALRDAITRPRMQMAKDSHALDMLENTIWGDWNE